MTGNETCGNGVTSISRKTSAMFFYLAASGQSTIHNHMSPAHLMRKQNRLPFPRKSMKVYDIFVENITVSTGFLEYL